MKQITKKPASVAKQTFYWLCLFFDNLYTFEISAVRANLVGSLQLAALGAPGKRGHGELPDVGTSLVSSRLRYFALRYCHDSHLLQIIRDPRIPP